MWIITWITKLVQNGIVNTGNIMWILMSPCLHDAITWSMMWTIKAPIDMKTPQGAIMIFTDIRHQAQAGATREVQVHMTKRQGLTRIFNDASSILMMKQEDGAYGIFA